MAPQSKKKEAYLIIYYVDLEMLFICLLLNGNNDDACPDRLVTIFFH